MTSEIVSKFPTKIDHRMAPSSFSSLTSLHSHILPQSFTPNVRELVFLGGAPGSGKGTNSAYISQLKGFDAPAIVVSDLLNTPTCKQLKENGAMVNDEFVFKALCKELEKPIYRNGVVVDGFPRTSKQAEFLTDFYNQAKSSMHSPPQISFVMLHIDETASIERQQARGREALAMNEGRISLSLSPPVEVRTTDLNVEASKARYVVFREQLNAVMELTHQFPLVVVDASPPLEVVQANLANQIATLPAKQKRS